MALLPSAPDTASGAGLPAAPEFSLARSLPPVLRDPRIWYRLAKLLTVSVTGIGVNSVALSLFYGGVHLPLLLASAAAVEVAIVYNFALDNRWTFARTDLSIGRFMKYNLISLLGLSVTTPTVWLSVNHLGVHYLLANLIGLGVSGIVSLAGIVWTWGPQALATTTASKFPRRSGDGSRAFSAPPSPAPPRRATRMVPGPPIGAAWTAP